MTTAPTPSEAESLAVHLDQRAALAMPPVVDSLSKAAASMLRRLQADNERLQSSLDAQRLISDRAIALAKELEARKPLPLSIERLEQIWASLRSFHGNEPLKCGHVEFARLVEVEYGVLGRIPIREENGGQIDHSLIASREVADGPVRVTRLHITEEGRAGLTSKATGPLPGSTGGSS